MSSLTGTGNLTGSYTAPSEGWYTLRANNARTSQTPRYGMNAGGRKWPECKRTVAMRPTLGRPVSGPSASAPTARWRLGW